MIKNWVMVVILGLTFIPAPLWGQEPAVVIAGHIGVSGDAPLYVGLEKGFYKEMGIRVKLARFRGLDAMMVPMAGGNLQAARGGIAISTFNGFARGWPVKFVAATSTDAPGRSVDAIVIRPDLKDTIRGFNDLKGRKVALNSPVGPFVFVLGKALEQGGLTLKDVEKVALGFPSMAIALRNKAVDAAVTTEPFTTLLKDEGLAVILKQKAEFITHPYMLIGVLAYGKEWAEQNQPVAKNFMVAFLKSVRYFHEAAVGKANREEVIDILIKHTGIKNRVIYERMPWNYIDPDLTFSKESLEQQQDWYHRQGMLSTKVEVDKMYDPAYVQYALAQLGPYRNKK